jgi:hypothetical protein
LWAEQTWGTCSLLVGAGAAGAVALTLSADYRLDRLTAFLDPWADPKDSGWQLIQSLYSPWAPAVFFGLGLARSRQKYLYLPYPETDFIFAIIGEELGFIGATFLILLYLVLDLAGHPGGVVCPGFIWQLTGCRHYLHDSHPGGDQHSGSNSFHASDRAALALYQLRRLLPGYFSDQYRRVA